MALYLRFHVKIGFSNFFKVLRTTVLSNPNTGLGEYSSRLCSSPEIDKETLGRAGLREERWLGVRERKEVAQAGRASTQARQWLWKGILLPEELTSVRRTSLAELGEIQHVHDHLQSFHFS